MGQRPPPPLLLLLLALVPVPSDALFGPPAGSACKMQYCNDLYVASEDSLGLRIDETEYRQQERHDKRTFCLILRTFSRCLNDTAAACRSDLQFHAMHRGAANKLSRYGCQHSGELFTIPDPGSYPPPTRTPPDVCTYQGGSGLTRHCGLFGDPHLRTFTNALETCRVEGAWPLVDNDYLTVQVTNQPVGEWEGLATATATTKVTVLVKAHSKCGPVDYVTYQAAHGLLPAAFDDGQVTLGMGRRGGVVLREVTPGHVEIVLGYVNTTVVVRSVGAFYNVVLLLPEEVVRESLLADPDRLDLCQKGCPRVERIDHVGILAQKAREERLARRSTHVSLRAAAAACAHAGLVDFYLDSCVFDLVTTGDRNFTAAAALALQDLYELYPQGAALHANRTKLDLARTPVVRSGAEGSRGARTSGLLGLLLLLLLARS